MGLKTISYLYLPVPGTRYFFGNPRTIVQDYLLIFYWNALFFSHNLIIFHYLHDFFPESNCLFSILVLGLLPRWTSGCGSSWQFPRLVESELITWLVLSTCFSYASCSKLYFWADEDRFRVVSNGWNPKIPSTFPKCSSWFSQVRMFLYVLLHKLLPPWARLAQAKTQEASS